MAHCERRPPQPPYSFTRNIRFLGDLLFEVLVEESRRVRRDASVRSWIILWSVTLPRRTRRVPRRVCNRSAPTRGGQPPSAWWACISPSTGRLRPILRCTACSHTLRRRNCQCPWATAACCSTADRCGTRHCCHLCSRSRCSRWCPVPEFCKCKCSEPCPRGSLSSGYPQESCTAPPQSRRVAAQPSGTRPHFQVRGRHGRQHTHRGRRPTRPPPLLHHSRVRTCPAIRRRTYIRTLGKSNSLLPWPPRL
mmetsp:Transcript_22375/g.74239  ORF Transcript_22375/g.74239 Transcript_22375/m.74239 type:complete len:250 (-) Transcript_22375:104-853(-)